MKHNPDNQQHQTLQAKYQPPVYAKRWCDHVLQTPGLYLVVGERQMGKSALLRYLTDEFTKKKITVVAFNFRRGARQPWSAVWRHLYQEIATLRSTRLSQYANIWDWVESRLSTVRPEHPLCIIIDDLQEMHPFDLEKIDTLLPEFDLKNTHVIITSSKNNSILEKLPSLQLENLVFEDIKNLTDAFHLSHPHDRIAREIHARTQGKPLLVYELCCMVQHSDQALSLLQQVPFNLNIEQLMEYRLNMIEGIIAEYSKSNVNLQIRLLQLMRRLLGLLTVAAIPLPFEEVWQFLHCDFEDLNILYQSLGHHIVNEQGEFTLTSMVFRDYLRQTPERGHRYAPVVREYAERLPRMFYRRYQSHLTNLEQLPGYILRHVARWSVELGHVEEVFAHHAWKLALEEREDSLEVVRTTIREAREVAEQLPEPRAKVLAVTACAVMETSLAALLPPELLVNLVYRKLWSTGRALAYARGYTSIGDYLKLQAWLDSTQVTSLPILYDLYRDLAKQLGNIAGLASEEQRYYLRLALQPYEITSHDKPDIISILHQDALLDEDSKNGLNIDRSCELFALIDKLEKETLAAHRSDVIGRNIIQLSRQQEDLLFKIAQEWSAAIPIDLSANRYVQITRLIAGSTRANYFAALDILAPAIRRVFGAECAERMARMIEKITEAYP
ncbi:ATP-binding protein [Candidatus Viridilinea mediisalina]|uniref:ORC1/DEAH AAA+ ATPase domain-containing protein n=1 Tax=Candidatus Viridilinea mediisalina TaxID=2024553 RepID=A0A2A6RGX3_9CHLR|nr:ATP-binding protein [Candidatus Viridilinea mediisalina]PDW02317.1 hypothetical protein CJ255_14620 [Candidatus Viridilinea mediisalina]